MEQETIEKAIGTFDTEGLKMIIRSFVEAINRLDDRTVTAHLLYHLNRYLYFGVEPDTLVMNETVQNIWSLIKPYADEIRGRE